MGYIYKIKMLVIAVMLFIFNSSDSIAQISNFSGNWTVDSKGSAFGGLAENIAAPKDISVSLIKDSILVIRTFRDKDAVKETLKFNASPVETIPNGSTLKSASVKNDGKTIVFNWHYEMDGNEWRYDRTEKWALSADGKTLTIDRITTMSDKVDRVKAVYKREK